jgi:PAS domain-containing protein
VTPVDLPPQVETLLRRATDALEDCFAVYRAVRDEQGGVVDFQVEHLNEAACADMESAREDLVGRNLGELRAGYFHSSDFRWLRRVLESGERSSRTAVEYEPGVEGGRMLGRARDLRAAPAGGGRVVVTWRDATERARAERQLRMRSLALDHGAEGVCLVRAADGAIVYGNPHLAELLGFRPGELDGRLVPEIAVAVESGGDRTFEVLGRRKDGAIVRCEARVSEFEDPEHGKVWVAVVRELGGADRSTRRPAVARPPLVSPD